MKKTAPIIVAALALAACNQQQQPHLATRTDTLSWALGENTALTLQQGQVVDIDYNVFQQAVAHTLQGKPQPLADSAYQQAMQYIMMQASLQHLSQQQQQQSNIDEKQTEYFKQLEANNPNVKKHPKGFYYEVVRKGHGHNAKYAGSVRFDYRGYLMLTGQPFDQTYGQRPPIDHVVGSPMFEGLIEAFQLMNAGSLYRFWFPYQLAFGTKGSGGVPPYTPVIYEVELHEILD